MRASLLVSCLAVIVAGCAGSGGPDDVLPGEASATGRAKSAVNVIGTPVHVVVKGAACVATSVVALPVASVATITDDRQLRQDTDRTVGETCGGSWVLGRD
jgi:hypothetical protein